MNAALEQAIAVVGMRRLAVKIGTSHALIGHWRKTGEIPGRFVLPIADASGVSASELAPEIYPADRVRILKRPRRVSAEAPTERPGSSDVATTSD